MAKKLLIVLIIAVIFTSTGALAKTTIGLEIYPEKMDGILSNKNLVNGNEWFATIVQVEKTFLKHLTLKFNLKTYLFGTNGLSYYPSSVKFTNSLSYKIEAVKVKYQHYCWHYFHQYENNYSDQDKLVLEYSF